jgi:peptide/nickel transport system permease protein
VIGYLSRRSLLAAATLLAAVALVFVSVRLLPGNPILARYGQHVVPEKVAEEMAQHGWDQPVYAQLGSFLKNFFLYGDLGESFLRPGESVAAGLAQSVPATIELSFAALLLAAPLGVLTGIVAALWRGRWPDYLCMSLALLGVSVPVFFLGICLLTIFTGMPTGMRLPPGSGFESITGFYIPETLLRGRFDLFAAALQRICLPAIALSTIPMAVIARITRSSMLEVLSADYVRTARAKGAAFWRVVMRHALPNASIPIANIAGFQVGALLSGAVLTETVFSWPGLGTYLVDAVKGSDYSVVQGGALVVAAVFVIMNLALDVLYFWLDPRLREARGAG